MSRFSRHPLPWPGAAVPLLFRVTGPSIPWAGVESFLKRNRAEVAFSVIVLPWVLYSAVGPPQSPWFPITELSLIAGAAAGLVSGAIRLGVHKGRWPALLIVYAAILNVGIAEFAYLFWSAGQRDSSAFSEPLSKIDAAYFSWSTFTTTGFGDIAAHSQLTRLEVMGEMVLTFGAVAGGLAVLIGLFEPVRRQPRLVDRMP